jgi:hypothetical protein
MASSFAALRSKRKTSDLEAIQAKLKASKSNTSRDEVEDDDTYWTLKHIIGQDGKGTARIRFLPATEGEDDPYVKWQEYAFKGKSGKWYINKSRISLGKNESDPAYEYNGKIFGDKSLTKEQRMKKLLNRNEFTVANILVESDPAAPHYEGNNYKFKFGPQIWNMIEAKLFPQFDDQKPVNVFDPFEGASFTIRAKQKKIPNRNGDGTVSVPTYEDSSFGEVSSIVDDEADFDVIWERQYPLKEIVSEDKFKPYDQLVKEFNRAMDIESSDEESEDEDEKPKTRVSRKETVEEPELETRSTKGTSGYKSKTTTTQDLDDEIPFEEEEVVKETTSKASNKTKTVKPEKTAILEDDDDDWFNSLKK